jgi:hypothetical protein
MLARIGTNTACPKAATMSTASLAVERDFKQQNTKGKTDEFFGHR